MPVVLKVGKGDTPHVFVHGGFGSHDVFARILERAPRRTRCVMVDLPDHGQGGDAPDATLDDLERDVAEVIASQRRPAVVIGHALGGYLVARVLPEVAEHVRRVILLSSMPAVTPAMRNAALEIADSFEGGKITKAELADRAVDHWLGDDADEEAERRVRALVSAQPDERIVRTLRRLGQANGDRKVGRYDVPATLMHARDDRTVPFERSMRLAVCSRRQNELRPVAGTAHLLPLTHPSLVAQRIFAP